MSRYLKMANVFDSSVEPRNSSNGGTLIMHANKAYYAAHAINSHDELVAMNQELLEALEVVWDAVEFAFDGSFMQDGERDLVKSAIAKAKAKGQ